VIEVIAVADDTAQTRQMHAESTRAHLPGSANKYILPQTSDRMSYQWTEDAPMGVSTSSGQSVRRKSPTNFSRGEIRPL